MQQETYHSIGLLLNPVDIIIPYVYQFLHFVYIKLIILDNLSRFLVYLQKKSIINIKLNQYLRKKLKNVLIEKAWDFLANFLFL